MTSLEIIELSNEDSLLFLGNPKFRQSFGGSSVGLNIKHVNNKNLAKFFKDIEGVYSLHLMNCEINNVSGLSGIHTLTLTDCPNITNLSGLVNVHTLEIYRCNGLSDVSGLSWVYSLTLFGCIGITNVSGLVNVHTVNLRYCHEITNVRGFDNVHTLSLVSCDGISYIRDLGGVLILKINKCIRNTNQSALPKVDNLIWMILE